MPVVSHVDVLRTEGGPPLPDRPSTAAVLHKPGIAGRGAGRPRVAAPFPRCPRVPLYLHALRRFPARLHHARVRARLTVKTIAVASASAVPQKKAPSAAILRGWLRLSHYDVAWKAMDGDLGAYCRGLSETVGLYCMDKAFDHGFREITMKSKPINMPDDLKGVKIRLPVAPLFIALFQHLGASPTPINFGEVYSALQTGLVDGQENPLILIDTAKLYEVQKYCSMTNHIWVGLHISFNPAAWKRLPPDLQELTHKRFSEAAIAERADWQGMEKTEIDKMTKAGLVFNSPDTKPFQEALRKSGFYPDVKKQMGDEAWALLEKYVGPLA